MDFYNGSDHFSIKSSWEIGRWYHLALVDDGTASVKLYIDGVLDKSDDGALRNPNRFPCHGTDYCFELQFGGYYETHDVEYFKGQVDEVSLYNRALNPNEIQSIFTAGSQGKCRTEDNCHDELATCLANAASCNANLGQCTATLSTTQDTLASCTSNLSTCSTSLNSCNQSLATSTASLSEAERGLLEIQRLQSLPFGLRASTFSCSGQLCADIMAVIHQLLNPAGQGQRRGQASSKPTPKTKELPPD